MSSSVVNPEASAKPYLVRALCEWCAEKDLTPYLVVRVNEETQVPVEYVANNEIVFNLSDRTTHHLTIDNEWIMFAARFGGISQEIAIPFSAVAAIFARENGYGLFFSTDQESIETAGTPQNQSPEKEKKGARHRAHLKLVK
jgi:Stringent starvation protein B